MMRLRATTALAAVLIVLGAYYIDAQEPAAPAATSKAPVAVPLQVQVVISRFQGEKKISSLPYTLSVTADGRDRAQIRMGADVPVPSTTFQPIPSPSSDKPAPAPMSSFSYRNVGIEIDCTASPTDDGRFRLTIAISDSSVYSDAQDITAVKGNPVLRSFRSTNIVVLRDGQSRQFTAATDRVSGEVVRGEVTLTVLK